MSTEQMRSEFEAWWEKNNCDVKTPMGILVKGIAEKAWRESRAALVVKLPTPMDGDCGASYSFNEALDLCASSIRAAGITVRDE